eukprot:6476566-Amphidinium_carterae.3
MKKNNTEQRGINIRQQSQDSQRIYEGIMQSVQQYRTRKDDTACEGDDQTTTFNGKLDDIRRQVTITNFYAHVLQIPITIEESNDTATRPVQQRQQPGVTRRAQHWLNYYLYSYEHDDDVHN